MAKFNTGVSFTDGSTVTGADLNNITSLLNIYSGVIADQAAIVATVSTADLLLIADTDNGSAGAANKVTAQKLFTDILTNGTFTNFNLSDNLTYGTATGNRTISTSATITNGTITTGVIPTGTFGTTTSTAATITNGTITTGLIPTLTAGTTTGTAGIFTSGTIATLNSTTGTITNLSTTLAGDFTITQGTGTIGTGVVTAAKMANPQYTGFRNRIINGDMRIDQRNAGASITPTDGQFSVDRFSIGITAASKITAQQNAGSVTPPTGFSNYLGITTIAAYSVAAGDVFNIGQGIEGFNTADLNWGTANASTVTLSFWVRSSLTGTFGGALRNSVGNRSYPFTYTISSANTWEYETITIAGDTSGTWVGATNGVGIRLSLGLGVGSTYSGTAGAWAGANYYSATGATSVVGTNGATFYITGVQLEQGSTATDFERRPIGTELALCQRYYYLLTTASTRELFNGQAYNTTSVFGKILDLPVSMRSSPTVILIGSLSPSSSNGLIQTSFLTNTFNGASQTMLTTGGLTGSSGLTAGNSSVVYLSAGGGLSISAEL